MPFDCACLLPPNIPEKAFRDAPHHVEAELRVLVIELEQHFVGHLVELAIGFANKCLRSLLVWREKPDFSDKLFRHYLSSNLGKLQFSLCNIDQLVRDISLAEHDIA